MDGDTFMKDKLIVGIDIGKRTHVATIIDYESDESIVSLRNLSRFRVTLSQQITDTKRRIVTILDQVFPEFESLFSDMFGKTAKALLEEYPTPESFESITTRKLANLIVKLSKGHFKKEKAEEIKEKASSSFGIDFALSSFKLELSLLLKQLDFLNEQITVVEKEIGQIMQRMSTTLTTLPGVNTILAAAIISEIGDIHRFRTSSQLVSFADINPTVHQSGQFTGNKNKMTILGAVSRKLCGIIFAMMRDNKKFTRNVCPPTRRI